MEEHIGFLTTNGDIGCGSFGDGIGRCGDILLFFVFCKFLIVACLDVLGETLGQFHILIASTAHELTVGCPRLALGTVNWQLC